MASWAVRISLGIADQGVMSGANFLLSVLLARWLSPTQFGQFAVAFSVFLFLASFHNALIVEPMSVLGAARHHENLPAYRSSLVWLHVGLTCALSLLTAGGAYLVPDRELQASLWALAVATPTMLLFWLFRRAYYLESHASWSAVTSLIYAVALLGLVLLLRQAGWLSAATAVLAMGGAGAVASLPSWGRLKLDLIGRNSPRVEEVLEISRTHVSYGRWMVTTDIFTLGSYQIQTFLVAGLLGLEAAGVLRAMQAFTMPMVQVITAVGVISLPVMSHTFAQQGLPALRRKGLLLTAVLGAAAGLYALLLVTLASPLERLLYGGKFSEFTWVIGIFGLLPIFGALAQTYSLMLRPLRRPRYYLVVGLVPSCTGLLLAVPLILVGGLGGAALSIVVTSAASAATNYWLYRRWIAPLPRGSREEALAA